MGTTTRVGRDPLTMGAAMPTRVGTEKMVKVCWRTVVEHEVMVPVSAWERMDGAEGSTEGALDDYLSDLETGEYDTGVTEREVTVVEPGYES